MHGRFVGRFWVLGSGFSSAEPFHPVSLQAGVNDGIKERRQDCFLELMVMNQSYASFVLLVLKYR